MNSCIIWAVAMYLRRRRRCRVLIKQGKPGFRSYLTARRSDAGFFPHFLYEEERGDGRRIMSYVPLDSNTDSLPWPLFEGWVKWGDPRKDKS